MLLGCLRSWCTELLLDFQLSCVLAFVRDFLSLALCLWCIPFTSALVADASMRSALKYLPVRCHEPGTWAVNLPYNYSSAFWASFPIYIYCVNSTSSYCTTCHRKTCNGKLCDIIRGAQGSLEHGSGGACSDISWLNSVKWVGDFYHVLEYAFDHVSIWRAVPLAFGVRNGCDTAR